MKQTSRKIPRHVAIIMDGNGRWARQRGLPRIEGHRRGVEAVRRTVKACYELGITHLTLYAFSSENWGRPAGEINALMRLLATFLRKETAELAKEGIRLHAIGRISELRPAALRELERACAATAGGTRHLILALNYGSRTEFVDAMRGVAAGAAAGRIVPDRLDYESASRFLYTSGLPDPDLVIRTSGETRLSNFLMLQAAYAELLFMPVLWPDFDRQHLVEALEVYAGRQRRFGLTSEQAQDGSS